MDPDANGVKDFALGGYFGVKDFRGAMQGECKLMRCLWRSASSNLMLI